MTRLIDHECYTAEWKRTRPDYVVYLPPSLDGNDGYNDHFLVDVTQGGDLLAIWTQGSSEAARDLRVVCSLSMDGGTTWSPPVGIGRDEIGLSLPHCFGFPVISHGPFVRMSLRRILHKV